MYVMYERFRQKSTFVKVIGIVGMVILGALGAACFAFLFGYLVMLLWNWLMPMLFNLPFITFWPAVGIIILARLIFGGFKHGSHGHHRPSKYSSRWKSHFNRKECNGFKWDAWKHYDNYWKEEGEQAFHDYINRKKEEKE